ncbi:MULTISPECIES: hypothetical protein [unclassified Streptomyces]|uniref:Pepco domain-containing protein n=1 Tax=unclassified Streptomyces TaxID=2593676 RepID=UPI001488A039|nr:MULTISPECIES: hypothetical protein [unclassified Streptomyces]
MRIIEVSEDGAVALNSDISAYVTGLDILVRAEPEEHDSSGASSAGSKGFIGPRNSAELTTVAMRSEQLRENLERTVQSLREIFERIADSEGNFPLKEVQVSFEVSAKGGIRLIGTSEVAGKGGITLVFGPRDRGE